MSGLLQFVRRQRADRSGLVAALVLALLASVIGLAPSARADVLPAPVVTAPADTAAPRLSWAPVPGASRYRVLMSKQADLSSPFFTVTTDNQQATPLSDIPSDVTIFWSVAALDASNLPGTPTNGSFTRPGGAAPNLLSPTNGGVFTYPDDPPILRWNPQPRMASYVVWVDDNAGFNSPDAFTVRGTSLALQASLAYGTTQYWQVKGQSVTPGLETAWSATRTFSTTWPLANAVPANLSPPNDPAGTSAVTDVRLTWDPVAGAKAYDLQVSLAADFSDSTRLVYTGRVKGTTWSPDPALGNASYYWRVRAVDFGGQALSNGWTTTRTFRRAWGPQDGRSMTPGPIDPTVLAFPAPQPSSSSGTVSRDAFRLEWSPVHRVGAYVVQISSKNTFPTATPGENTVTCTTYRTVLTLNMQTNDWKPFPVVPVGASILVPGTVPCDQLEPTMPFVNAKTYYWRVRAVDTSSKPRPANDSNPVLTPWSSDVQDPTNPPSFQFDATHPVTPTAGPSVQLVQPLDDVVFRDAPELTWKPVTAYSLYRVQISLDAAFSNPQAVQYTTSTRLVPAGSIKENNTGEAYYWRVQACTTVGDCQPTVGSRRFVKRDEPVSDATATVRGDEVDFSWRSYLSTPNAAGVVRSYRLQVAAQADFSGPLVTDVNVDPPFFTAYDDLYPVGTYYWRVQAVDDNGQGLPWSETQTFDRTSTAPTASSTVPQAAVPTLTWTAQPLASAYQVQIFAGADPGKSFPPAAKIADSGNLLSAAYTAYDKILGPGTYSWRVRKIDADGQPGNWNTDAASVTSPPTFDITAPAPGGLSPAPGASLLPGQRLFSWSPVPGAVSYRVTLSSQAGVVESPAITVFEQYAVVAPLVAGTDYTWRVAALNAGGTVLSETDEKPFTARTAPGTPGMTLAASGTSLSVGYSPTTTGGSALTGYTIRYRAQGAPTWTTLSRAANTASVAISGLAQSTRYDVQVAAENAVGTSPWAPVQSATTATVPGVPTSLRVTPGTGQLTVTWGRPADGGSPITAFRIRWSAGGASAQLAVDPNTAYFVIPGLSAGTAYSVDIAAENLVGSSLFATAVQGTPTAATSTTPPGTGGGGGTAGSSTPTSLSILGGGTIKSGASATLHGTLSSSTGAPVAGRSVTLQSAPAGSTSWTTAATLTTTSTGTWSAAVRPSANRSYRAVFTGAAPNLASTSGTATVRVAVVITRTLSANKVKRGTTVSFVGIVKPGHAGRTVYLQRLEGGKWVSKKSAKVSSTSGYTFHWKATTSTDYAFRITLPAHADHAAGYSTKITLTVK